MDIDGNAFKGKVWDKIWFSAKAAEIAKSKLEALGFNTSDLLIESEDDIKDLAADVKEKCVGNPVALVTENREDDNGAKYKDDTPKFWTDVAFVNGVN